MLKDKLFLRYFKKSKRKITQFILYYFFNPYYCNLLSYKHKKI